MAKNRDTVMYQLTETSEFMMSYVIITREDNVIIIDGGRKADMPLLKEYVGGRHVRAWILTHPHEDHIDGFLNELEENGLSDFDVETIICRFPTRDELESAVPVCKEYFDRDVAACMPRVYEWFPRIGGKLFVPQRGDCITVDECRIEFLYTYHKQLTGNVMNDSSLVFKVVTPGTSVLFLGDLGPEGGDYLYWESRDRIRADIVQMAHHGHMNCSMEVYAAIAPEICMWNAPEWLYEEEEVPFYLADFEKSVRMGRTRMFGTAVTRKWMDALGVKQHYVTKDGTNRIVL